MAVKTINISLDKDEYAIAFSKKGERTWKQILFDGLEYKVYVPEKRTKVATYLQSRPQTRKKKTG